MGDPESLVKYILPYYADHNAVTGTAHRFFTPENRAISERLIVLPTLVAIKLHWNKNDQ